MLPLEFKLEREGKGLIDSEKVDAIFYNLMDDIADEAERVFIQHIPFQSGRTLNALEKGDINKHPGFYSVSIGIRPIENVEPGEDPEYPLFVHEGTGIFAKDGNRGLILPKGFGQGEVGDDLFSNEPGNVIAFQKGGDGELVFTRYVKGQQPQSYLDDVHREMERYLAFKRTELKVLLSRV